MFNRRNFLQLSAAATVAAAAPESVIAKTSDLPPRIAALQPLTAGVTPITKDERAARIEKARRLMRESKLDALLLAGGTSLDYFSAIQWALSERFFGMILPVTGEPFYVSPAFEEDRAREQIANGPLDGKTAEVRTWHEHESPYERIAQGLKDRGIAAGNLGIEEKTHFVFGDSLAKAAPGLRLVSGTPITAGCRMVKSPAELALMRHASKITWLAYKAAYESLKTGMTQNDFERLVSAAHERLGFPGGAGMQVGEYSALPHGSVQPQIVREGAIVLVDGGCKVHGYTSDISRTFVLGKPTDKMKSVFAIERRAQDAALAAAKPGVLCEAVDAAARKVIEDAGYGPGYKYFTHRVGHGMGMDVHEWPYLVKGNTLPLVAGMTFSDEPGIYIRGEFGVRLEDDMFITAEGAELMTPQSHSLEQPFAE